MLCNSIMDFYQVQDSANQFRIQEEFDSLNH